MNQSNALSAMEPTVKEKEQLYLLSSESSWSFLLPIPGLMEEKEAHIINLTRRSPQGEDPPRIPRQGRPLGQR